MDSLLQIKLRGSELYLSFLGELTVYNLSKIQKKINTIAFTKYTQIHFSLQQVDFIDSAAALYIDQIFQELEDSRIEHSIDFGNENIAYAFTLVHSKRKEKSQKDKKDKKSIYERIGIGTYENYRRINLFIGFLGKVFIHFLLYIKFPRKIRYKEILFEINESAIKAVWIIALTSFLVGLVVAYQSAYQLKLYGANIFIVDMLGLSVLRELAPLMAAIVIAGRSGSAYTAQIGAMKITQEIDAMKTMGFEPYSFLVLPRIIALSITMPLLVFVADIMGMLGGMIIANIDLNITPDLFLDRFHEVIAAKHFFVGVVKGPFFAFLIATIAIYRGLIVKDDTQSIGFNTTKSVVESIFAVIVCDALFSIAFTNLGI